MRHQFEPQNEAGRGSVLSKIRFIVLACVVALTAVSVGGVGALLIASDNGVKPSNTPVPKRKTPKPPPFDAATAVQKIEVAMKEAKAAEAKSEWGDAFRASVKAWEAARHHRNHPQVQPLMKSIEAALEEFGEKSNGKYEAAIKSSSVIHMEK